MIAASVIQRDTLAVLTRYNFNCSKSCAPSNRNMKEISNAAHIAIASVAINIIIVKYRRYSCASEP